MTRNMDGFLEILGMYARIAAEEFRYSHPDEYPTPLLEGLVGVLKSTFAVRGLFNKKYPVDAEALWRKILCQQNPGQKDYFLSCPAMEVHNCAGEIYETLQSPKNYGDRRGLIFSYCETIAEALEDPEGLPTNPENVPEDTPVVRILPWRGKSSSPR